MLVSLNCWWQIVVASYFVNFSIAPPIHFHRGKNKIVKFFCFVFSFDEMLRNGEKIDKSREKEGIEGKTSSTLFGVRGGACYALQGNNYSLLFP